MPNISLMFTFLNPGITPIMCSIKTNRIIKQCVCVCAGLCYVGCFILYPTTQVLIHTAYIQYNNTIRCKLCYRKQFPEPQFIDGNLESCVICCRKAFSSKYIQKMCGCGYEILSV